MKGMAERLEQVWKIFSEGESRQALMKLGARSAAPGSASKAAKSRVILAASAGKWVPKAAVDRQRGACPLCQEPCPTSHQAACSLQITRGP